MNNNVISIKRNTKDKYFIDFIDWRNYTIVVDASSEQEAIEIVTNKARNKDLSDLLPTKHLFEILKVQTTNEEE